MPRSTEITVTFVPGSRHVHELPGTSITEAAGRAGLILNSPCGGRGTCGKCRVRVVEGQCPITDADRAFFSRAELEEGWRLGCQGHVETDVTLEIPAESLFSDHHQILTHDTWRQGDLKPVIRKRYFKLHPPDRHHPEADLTRLRAAVGDFTISLNQLRHLPSFLRRNTWCGTAVIANRWLIRLEEGDTSDELYGIAFDVGTTTIVGTLMDLKRNRELAAASEVNPQVTCGDDVVSRIQYLRENESGLKELQELLVESLNRLIAQLAQRESIETRRIYDITVAGNSTMQQILCGLDSEALGELPFAQVFDQGWRFDAADIGLAANPEALVYVFPQIGGFVGGDTVAGLLAAGSGRWHKTWLFIDIGTNGEIVICRNGHLFATSTAAGPALEGARIRHGLRACEGAIEKVVLDDDVRCNVIGDVPPIGLCGTALIDAVAEFLRLGIIDQTGRFANSATLREALPDALVDRLVGEKKERRFILVDGAESRTGEPICLWQRDIRELQLATGAIRAGVLTLLRRLRMKESDLGEVLLAGAFGNFIRRSNARRIGLLPQIPCGRMRFIGNAVSLGAKLTLLSIDEQKRAEGIRAMTEHLDLSLDPHFRDEFAEAMEFPPPNALETCD